MDRMAAMEVFIRVVDAGSFSAAAKQLRLGQPAVSKTIAQLEERIGVRLLLRSTQGLRRPKRGEISMTALSWSIEEADEAELAARGAGAALSGRLRISAAVTFARIHVIPCLPAFLAEHPALDIDVALDDRNIDLIEAGVDLASRMGDLADFALTARRIGQSPRRVVGTPAYFKAKGTPHTPADLVAHQAVVYDQGGGGTAWTFRKGAAELRRRRRAHGRASAAEGVREGVSEPGLAIGSEWMFMPELKSGCGQVRAETRLDVAKTQTFWPFFRPDGRPALRRVRLRVISRSFWQIRKLVGRSELKPVNS